MLRRIAALLGLVISIHVSIAVAGPEPVSSQASDTHIVFIPLIQKELPPSPPPPPPANSVTVKSARSFIRNDSRFLVGEVINTTTNTVFDVRIHASFYDANNRLVTEGVVYAGATGIAPGAVSPFRMAVNNGNHLGLRYEFDVTYAASPTYNYRPLTILSHQTRVLNGTEVYGEMRNDNPDVLIGVMSIVTYYDTVGNVIDVIPDQSGNINRVVPGQTVSFNNRYYYNVNFTSYSVIANGKVGQ